jgi:hypothetical protein
VRPAVSPTRPAVSPTRQHHLSSAGEGGSKYNTLRPQAEKTKNSEKLNISYFIINNQNLR